jgi:dolichol-phosphate mannosyltransferase
LKKFIVQKAASAQRFIKFGIVGGGGTLLNIGLLQLFVSYMGIDYKIGSIFAIEISIINNFLWNYHWTWRDRQAATKTGKLRNFLRFNISCAFTGFVVNWGLLVFLKEVFHMHFQVANIIGITCGALINFIVGHYWVFPKKVLGHADGDTKKTH